MIQIQLFFGSNLLISGAWPGIILVPNIINIKLKRTRQIRNTFQLSFLKEDKTELNRACRL